MAKILALVTGTLLAAGCGARFVPLDIQESWFACGDDRECTVLEDPRCSLIPINRRYARDFADWVRRYRATQVSAHPCARRAFRYDAVCESARCSSSLVRPEGADPAGGDAL